jgi:DNA-binding transcriptional LysR family regulator
VSARQLESEPFILREKGSGTREIIEAEMRRVGVPLREAMEFGSTEAVKEAVAANLGISVVSAHAVTQEVTLGRLRTVRISDLNLRHPFCLLSLKNVPMSPAAISFRRLLFERRRGLADMGGATPPKPPSSETARPSRAAPRDT